jgi:cellulose synthase/poly-beta-1,6-N-acetylglucosamine synthase-like glycosyltransferase
MRPAIGGRLGGWMLTAATLMLAIVLPAFLYALIDSVLPGSIPNLQYVVACAYGLTAMMTLLEARAAMGTRDQPEAAELEGLTDLAELPTLTAIVSAYLPNEQELVVETIVHLATELRVAPGRLQIILAYNTPDDMPDVECVLDSLAALHVAFTPLRVPNSRSKAENINAAMGLVRGEVTLLLDADHRPARDAAVRALRWFGAGYDIVQGRCVIRDHGNSWLARVVAVEFEQIYAVAHAGRSLAFDTAMFGGTNGWWRTSVLRQIGMNDQMLTEDIDSSVRALLAGHRTVHDRTVISTELAPPTAKAWWGQRTRWAQGWFQVTLRHQAAIVRSPRLSTELKLYWTYLLGWRELFPVLSLQIFSLLLADALLGRAFTWFSNPFLVITTIVTLIAGPLAAVMTYRVALEDQRRDLRRWFFIYAAGSLLYTTAKNTVAMVANVRELIGQRSWIVTSRSVPAIAAALAVALATTSAPAHAAAAGAAAAAAETTVVPLAPLASTMTLTGRAPIATFSVAVPNDWTTVGGTLRLAWQASPSVTRNSTLAVRIGGALVAARPVAGGVGGWTLRIPTQAVPGHALSIELDGQLHTRVDTACCIPDSASSAIVALDPQRTSAALTGRRATAAPLLADLPGTLVDATGTRATPLYIALPAKPHGDDVRAAMLIAGAVARLTPGLTLPIKVVIGASVPAIRALPGQVVRIVRQGHARVSVSRRPNGRLILTVAGSRGGQVRAAWALAKANPPFLVGQAATITGGLDFGPQPAPPTAAKLAPLAGEGTGPIQLLTTFRLPVSRELTNAKVHLELDLGYTAPAGGRVDFALNGQPLAARALATQGSSQLRLSADIVRDPVDSLNTGSVIGELAPGDNLLTIHAALPAGQPVGGAGDAEAPELHVLPTSAVSFASRPRTGPATLALWPWPYTSTGGSAMSGTTVVLPANPTASELAWMIWTIAEASRWTAAPAAPQVAIAPPSLPAGPVVVLGRGVTTPVALPDGAPAQPRIGLLETYAAQGRQLLVAYDVRALRPLGSGYFAGRVKGLAAVVAPSGTVTTLVGAPAATSFAKATGTWRIPVAILLVAALGLLLLRVRKTRRRLDDLPDPPTAPLHDDHAVSAELAGWERMVKEDANGPRPRDDASIKS